MLHLDRIMIFMMLFCFFVAAGAEDSGTPADEQCAVPASAGGALPGAPCHAGYAHQGAGEGGKGASKGTR